MTVLLQNDVKTLQEQKVTNKNIRAQGNLADKATDGLQGMFKMFKGTFFILFAYDEKKKVTLSASELHIAGCF